MTEETTARRPYNPSEPYIPADFPGVTTPEGAPVVQELVSPDAIEAALRADKRVNEHLVEIDVKEGLVHLTGRQDTIDAVEAAGETAANVPGVAGVINDLEVRPSV